MQYAVCDPIAPPPPPPPSSSSVLVAERVHQDAALASLYDFGQKRMYRTDHAEMRRRHEKRVKNGRLSNNHLCDFSHQKPALPRSDISIFLIRQSEYELK